MKKPEALQREYYEQTAISYDAAHLDNGDEHDFALGFLHGSLNYLGAESVLDVGAGTGRAMTRLKQLAPHLTVRGIEPVGGLREIAYSKGVSEEELTDGDGTCLAFDDGAFDVVCAFGVLHHVEDHGAVVREMLRVSRLGIFISDCNNFGQGGLLARVIKQGLHQTHLWRTANLLKTRGKGYSITEGDGLAYSYSVFDDYKLVRAQCKRVHILNTVPAGKNAYRSASHVAMLGVL